MIEISAVNIFRAFRSKGFHIEVTIEVLDNFGEITDDLLLVFDTDEGSIRTTIFCDWSVLEEKSFKERLSTKDFKKLKEISEDDQDYILNIVKCFKILMKKHKVKK